MHGQFPLHESVWNFRIKSPLNWRSGSDSAPPWPSDVSRIAQSFPVSTRGGIATLVSVASRHNSSREVFVTAPTF